MSRGGVRPGAGRKSIADEERTREKAKAAILEKYQTLEGGLKSLLESQEPALIKFVFEHAFGKPTENLDLQSEGKMEVVVKYERRSNTAGTP